MMASGGGNKKEAAKALLKSAWTATRSLATNKSKTELLVEDATNLEPWGPTGQQMNDVAEASFDAEKFSQVWNVILKRFECEPKDWRRVYKALLLTEHLLKNSSQHVVQTILDGQGVLEGLKQFKYLDEKNKDQGINVSNRAKELLLLLGDSERIRAERAKARSLKEKFKGATREEMAATASGGSFTSATAGPSGYGGSPGAGAGSSYYSPSASVNSDAGSAARYDDIGASKHFEGLRLGSNGGSGASGSPRPPGRRQLLAADQGDDDGDDRAHLGTEGRSSSARTSPAKGEGALSATGGADPMAATAQRISNLRQAGRLENAAASSYTGGAGGSGSMQPSRSHDDLAVVHSGGSQTSKPSLAELMARKAGPKKLQEVRVNPSIAATLGAIKPPQPASGSGSKPAGQAPVALVPPPAAAAIQAAQVADWGTPAPHHSPAGLSSAAASAPSSPAGLADLLAASAPPAAAPGSPSPAAPSSGSSSPRATSSPPPAATSPNAFGAFDVAAPFGGPDDTTTGFAAFTKASGSPAGTISLTVSAAHGSGTYALPAHLFAEPTLPLPHFGSAASWGTHIGGVALPAAKQAAVGSSPMGGSQLAAPAGGGAPAAAVKTGDELFSDFSPFK